ncbi:hypothetical protein ES332_A01G081700v1 [Gossypium tomentosum]|uniref:Uncharacterized protein n=1 Tax=Gossypium tomentosum TaxID=34277 RepID=A0A5D2RNZ0_GOSTO|nr:hypothetical protein ES332_A01G081700v1 [Gossypium tomentosum]
MKALLVMVCILLASTLFIPTSTMARQLVAKDINDRPVFNTPRRNKPAVPCGRGMPYKSCIPGTQPPKKQPCIPTYNPHCH